MHRHRNFPDPEIKSPRTSKQCVARWDSRGNGPNVCERPIFGLLMACLPTSSLCDRRSPQTNSDHISYPYTWTWTSHGTVIAVPVPCVLNSTHVSGTPHQNSTAPFRKTSVTGLTNNEEMTCGTVSLISLTFLSRLGCVRFAK